MCSGVGRVAHYDPEPSGVATVTIRQELGWAGLAAVERGIARLLAMVWVRT
jgi:hypothetical protein